MVFSSPVFLFLFLPCVIFAYYVLLHGRTMRNLFLFLASLCFYAYGEPLFVFVMLLSIMGNWGFGLALDRYRAKKGVAKTILTVMLLFNLEIIFIFKYLMFTLTNLNIIFGAHIPVPQIALPIGISFFTFQAISYCVDVYRSGQDSDSEDVNYSLVQKSPVDVGLYIALFPQLIAGPIVRWSTIADQIKNRKENFDDFSDGVCRFIVGLAKKTVLANTVAVLADQVYSLPVEHLTIVTAWLGALAFTFQIYFDFSGYSDMAIGLGKMFGFHFLENFNYPYISRSVTEFWRRWHISLGSWFRDYVYFPLGGSRVPKGRLIINLFIVWSLTGLWHGANWTFILWGLLYFFLLVLEKTTTFVEKLGLFKWVWTFFFVNLGWVLFRSDTIAQAYSYICTMFGKGTAFDDYSLFYLSEFSVTLILCAVCSTPLFSYIKRKFGEKRYFRPFRFAALLFLLVASVSFAVTSTYNPFIYFNF